MHFQCGTSRSTPDITTGKSAPQTGSPSWTPPRGPIPRWQGRLSLRGPPTITHLCTPWAITPQPPHLSANRNQTPSTITCHVARAPATWCRLPRRTPQRVCEDATAAACHLLHHPPAVRKHAGTTGKSRPTGDHFCSWPVVTPRIAAAVTNHTHLRTMTLMAAVFAAVRHRLVSTGCRRLPNASYRYAAAVGARSFFGHPSDRLFRLDRRQ